MEAAAYTLYPVDTPENSVMWDSWVDKTNNPSKVPPPLITNPKKVFYSEPAEPVPVRHNIR